MENLLDISEVSDAEESRFYKTSRKDLRCFGTMQWRVSADETGDVLDGNISCCGESMEGQWVFNPRRKAVYRQDGDTEGVLVFEEAGKLWKYTGEVTDWQPSGKGVLVGYLEVQEGRFVDGKLMEGVIKKDGKIAERRKLDPVKEKDGSVQQLEGFRQTSKAFVHRGRFSPHTLAIIQTQVVKATREEKELFEPPK